MIQMKQIDVITPHIIWYFDDLETPLKLTKYLSVQKIAKKSLITCSKINTSYLTEYVIIKMTHHYVSPTH